MIIVAGTSRVPPARMTDWRAAAETVITATRAEAGCQTATRAEAGCQVYSFAEDVLEPGLIHIFEIWDSRAHLDAHSRMPHLTVWRAALAEIGVTDRAISIYETSGGTPL